MVGATCGERDAYTFFQTGFTLSLVYIRLCVFGESKRKSKSGNRQKQKQKM